MNICDLPDLPVRCGCNIFFPGCKKCSVTFSGGHWKLWQCGEHLGSFGVLFTVSLLEWILVNLDYTKKPRHGLRKINLSGVVSLDGTSNPAQKQKHQMHFELIMFCFGVIKLMRLCLSIHRKWRGNQHAKSLGG